MNKKTIYYIIGGVVILGIGYYLMNKNKKTGSEGKDDAEEVDSTKTDSTKKPSTTLVKTPVTIPATIPAKAIEKTKLTPQELESKLASGCGKKPKLKKNKVKYDECRANLTAKFKDEGLVAFDGSYSSQDNIVGGAFYSNFENSLDLDL